MRLRRFIGGFLGLRPLCLRSFSAETDVGDLNARQLTPMANGPMITFSATILEGDDLLVLALLNHFAGDSRALDEWIPARDFLSVAMKKYLSKHALFPGFLVEKIHIDDVAFSDAMLSAACFDNCVSHGSKKSRAKSHVGWLLTRRNCSRFQE